MDIPGPRSLLRGGVGMSGGYIQGVGIPEGCWSYQRVGIPEGRGWVCIPPRTLDLGYPPTHPPLLTLSGLMVTTTAHIVGKRAIRILLECCLVTVRNEVEAR